MKNQGKLIDTLKDIGLSVQEYLTSPDIIEEINKLDNTIQASLVQDTLLEIIHDADAPPNARVGAIKQYQSIPSEEELKETPNPIKFV